MKFATKSYDITHLTLGMFLHYLGKWKIQIFGKYSSEMEENANKLHFCRLRLFYWSTNFNILVFDIASFSPYWSQIKFSMSLFFYLFTFAIILWHRQFVTTDITAVFVNDQHGIQQRVQDFNKIT